MSEIDRIRSLYIELVKKSVLGFTIKDGGSVAEVEIPHNEIIRNIGADIPHQALSMIGLDRLNQLESCIIDVLQKGVPGDFIETGVWRGGCTIFMRAMLKAYDLNDRAVWVVDSFEGLPEADFESFPKETTIDFSAWKHLAITEDEVKNNFQLYGLLDDQVKFVKGYFKNVMPTLSINTISILRLDGDMYESTIQCLDALYPKLSIGGYAIIDDYGAVEACAEAVHDYRKKHTITEEIIKIDWSGAYWKKEK